MAAFSGIFTQSKTKGKSIVIKFLILINLTFAVGESMINSEAELLDRYRRAVSKDTVTSPIVVPENATSDVTLYDLTSNYPNRRYIVTNNSAGVQDVFQVTNGKLTLMPNLAADKRKFFDYEKFKTIVVMINAINQTDSTDVVMLDVTIRLSDVNDEPPVFANKPKPFYATLSQNAAPGTLVYSVTASDVDSNPNLVFRIDQDQTTENQRFQAQAVDSSNPAVKVFNINTLGSGAFQSGAEYTIKISVQDTNSVVGTQLTTDSIIVLIGNRAPQFFEQAYQGRIYESITSNSPNWVLEADSSNKLSIQVKQFQPTNALTYQLLEQNGAISQQFDIRTEDGTQRIVNKVLIDYEAIQTVSLNIRVTEAGTALSSSVPIVITIMDENDNAPKFFASQYRNQTVREDLPVGTPVVRVTANDLDSGLNGEIVFSILNSTYFNVTTEKINNSYVGTVTVKSPLDYDFNSSTILFNVIASDKGTPVLTAQVPTTVILQNVNDNPPTIVNTAYHNMTGVIGLNETAAINSVVTIIQATDIDGDAVKFYFKDKRNISDIFTIKDTNGQVFLNSAIPKNKNFYILEVIAIDDDTCCTVKTRFNTATATFTVSIIDFNVNKPNFNNCLEYNTKAIVREKAPPGTPVIQVNAFDPDRGANGEVFYKIETPDPNVADAAFQIDSKTGNITVKGRIIRDQSGYIQVTVVGYNSPVPSPMEGRCTFRVNIIDINDNPPTFSQAQYDIPVSIGTQPPSIIGQMLATDKDAGVNANVTYTFGMNDSVSLSIFSMNELTGVIRLSQNLDFSRTSYVLIVIANDNGKDPGPLTGTATVIVTVNFDNRKPPEWINPPNNPTYAVSESEGLNYMIATLSCQSNSDQTQLEFRVYDAGETIASDSKNFMIQLVNDSGVGVAKMNLVLRSPLDFEAKKEYRLNLVCQSIGAVVLRAQLLTPVINVLDANDEPPYFLGLNADGHYKGSVPENAPAGFSILQVSAGDKDTTPAFREVTFSLKGANQGFFQINYLGNNTADLRTTNLLKLDHETLDFYAVEIVAKDGGQTLPSNTVERYIDITVIDINDNAPFFNQSLYVFNVSENVSPRDIIGIVTADDPDSIDKGSLDYRFSDGNVNNAFNILSETGWIRASRKLDFESLTDPKIFNLTLLAIDSNQLHTATTTVQIQVLDENDNPPVFIPSQYIVMDKVTEEDKSITRQNPLFLVQVTATDADVARPKTIRYYQFDQQSALSQLFIVDELSGNVSLIGALDRDIPPFFYTITIEAKDEPVNSLSGYADVLIYPLDINDNAPEFDAQYLKGSVSEHSPNALVFTLVAVDRDAGNNQSVKYRAASVQPNSTMSSLFTVKENGDIYTVNDVALLDREITEFVYLVVQAYDEGTPVSLSSTATATITIVDVNDQSPFFEKPMNNITIYETTTGVILTIPAIDKDSDPKNKVLSFSLEPNIKFFIVESAGNLALISVAQPIDYEMDPHVFTFTLKVTDGAPNHENSTTVTVYVQDYNDNAPVIMPPEMSIILVEERLPGEIIATFNATDKDEGINGEIEFSIIRISDPRYEFYIHPTSGEVTTRKRLDREVQESMNILILAKDKGEIPLSSTATLHISLTDINDNAPRFLRNYRPIVPENVNNSNLLVETVFAMDPDTRQYGPPFGFGLPTPCNVPACSYFSLQFIETEDNGNGIARVYTSSRFDREERKYYYLPIVMWDMRGQQGSQTATNTLTITIGDENDNTLWPGNQDILIYNYEGKFTQIEIGRVYTEDPDDWDIADKTFTYVSPDNLKSYFIVNVETGMITLNPGLPPNIGKAPYQFKVDVHDKKWVKTVTCTVSVTIQLITDEAVRKSGGVRLKGITAEEFVKPVSGGTQNASPTSTYQKFRQAVSEMLGYPSYNNIEIVSLTDGEDFLDVRFSAHGSPYVNPSQGESAIMLNLNKFQQDVGVIVLQVPINLCMEENSDVGCYSYLNVTGKPELVNANGTSYVMMTTTLTPKEGCVDSIFPDPVECQGDYCFNGGTCYKDDWNKLSCSCNPGFDGPRCQQRKHSFDGSSAAFYQGLSTCAEGRTSIDFITLQEDGLIMYSGPIITINQTLDARDFLLLELKRGYPSLRLSLGGQEVSLLMTGKDSTGADKMSKLNDGQWHRLDIDRENQRVTLTVDHCKYATPINGTVQDWSPCRISQNVPGPDILLNVHSLLQLGGRYPNSSFPSYPTNVPAKGFIGCLRNLVHNTKLYDLYYKELPSWNSGKNGCPREETICGQDTAQPVCGQNAICDARWQPDKVSCRCKAGWYGDKCAKEAPAKDLQARSYFAWELRPALIVDTRRECSFQMMFRTRQNSGTLFVLTNAEGRTVLLQLIDGKLSLKYDMGRGISTLKLSNTPANTGQWNVVRVERYGNEFFLIMDGGEGRNFNYQVANTELGVFFEVLQPANTAIFAVTVGATLTNGNQIGDDLISTCIRDVRFNDNWLPLTTDQNNETTAGGRLVQSQGIKDGCIREDCPPTVTCPDGKYCYPLWETYECRCNLGTALDNNVCVASCNPNPCLNSGVCNIVAGIPKCTCAPGWIGATCSAQEQVTDDSGLGGGAIAGIVIAILVLLILLILLLIFLLTRQRSEKEKIIEVDPDDDYIRENIVFYDEEGAGEEDHAAYDITLLQRPMRETNAKPLFSPGTENELRARNAPPVDRRDIAPSPVGPNVGNFIKDRINDAENDDPTSDSTREFNFEGGNSDAGSLSSLNTSSSGGSQDYDYLSDWGPKFAKLADMYGAGQNQEDV